MLLEATTLQEAGWTETAIRRFLRPASTETRRSYSYGRYVVHLYDADAVMLAAQQEECMKFFRRSFANRAKRNSDPQPIDVLVATREASRSAHRWRDRATEQYSSGSRRYAGTCAANKRHWYALKEAGIIHLHRTGVLRYAGVSPQGMAVYEYGEGGLSCFHSTLHPVGVERTPVGDHPETLFVAAKGQQSDVLLRDVEFTLEWLDDNFEGDYERSASPSFARAPKTCWDCGEPGHVSRDCPERLFVAA